jgi:CHAT domain-containing protein/Tfp pilus assembly protein PilF
MSLGLCVLSLVIAAQSPAADSLYRLALRLPEPRLVVEARARPLAIREAVSEALARMARSEGERAEALHVARRLAAAYGAAWQDPFLSNQVTRFTGMPRAHQAAKIRADSLRRAGVTAFSREGPARAIGIWQRAVSAYRAVSDTAGLAGVLDNIGAGLVHLGQLDSAQTYLDRAGAMAHLVGDLRVQANVLGHWGDFHAEQGDLSRARARYAEALKLRERMGDTRGVAADYNNLGLVARDVGDLREARRQFEAALAVNRREARPELAATNLINLAGLAGLEGDFSRAESLYRSALATWRRMEAWAETAVALHGLGQLEMRRGNYAAAQSLLVEALEIYQRTGPVAEATQVRLALADALAASGNPQGAIDQLQAAQDLADSVGMAPGDRAGLALAQADLAWRLNALAESERRYLDAERLYRGARDPLGEAEARQGIGLLALVRDAPGRAEEYFAAALRAQITAGHLRAAAITRLSLGRAVWQRGDTTQARRQLAQAARELEQVGDPVAAAEALGERAALEAEAGRAPEAETLYRAALHRLAGRSTLETAWRLRTGLALALWAQGSLDAAAPVLRGAIDALEAPKRTLELPERRSAFLTDKWDSYALLALLEQARGLPGAAFEVSERLRAREMAELLDRGKIDARSDEPRDLIAQEQDLRRRLGELTRDLDPRARRNEAVRGPDPTRLDASTREGLIRAQEQYADLLLRIRERAPRHAALLTPRTASWREIAQRLEPTQALITYLLSDSGSVAFVVTRDTMAAVDLGVGRREIARMVDLVRGTLDLWRSDAPWRGSLQRLHALLIEPLENTGLLAGKTRLVLVPHLELHYLPFAALHASGPSARFLAERYEVSVTPSASAWLALGDRAGRRSDGGVLAYAPRPDALPASRREVAAVERLAGSSVQVRVGRTASEDAFRREAPGQRILHLASNGVLNKHNPLFSYVELAPGGGYDGRLEVHEVMGLRLDAELVVLSACQTGLGSGVRADVPAGDDWVSLTHAFLHAGAERVVATLWPVDDWVTAALMEEFYQAMARGLDPVRALAAAQRVLQAEASTAHPHFWAGFVIAEGATRRDD